MSPAPEQQASRPPRGKRSLSVRVRILTAVLLTTALGMLVAGGVSYLIAREQTYVGIRSALIQEKDEIDTVARRAADGQLGRTIKAPGDILYLAIKSSVPDPNEAILGLVNGKVVWVPDTNEASQKSIEEDTELLQAAGRVSPDEAVRVHQLKTAEHRSLAYISIPVQVKGSTDIGHYVAAVDVAAAFVPVNRTHYTLAAASLVALLAIGVVGYQVAGRLLSPLRALRQTAQRISDADLSDRIPEDQLASHDEVADLGHTMNAMLDRLSLSFDTQRRLLDDAGHELRTPITIVRGHLELLDPSDRADVVETRDIALDELDRMQRLVEDIMVLAKSRRPDFVRPEPVVVSDLLVMVADKITPLGDRRWTIEASTDAVVQLDRQRITQALVQLVANALRFTAPGSVIALGARTVGTDLRLWVRDEGVGISAEDQQRIFERFGRGEQAVPGLDEGAGLGLAIVTAIAEAHHGRVSLRSTIGVGSTFTLVLPIPSPADGPPAAATDSSDAPAGVAPHQAPPHTVQPDPSSEDRQWQPS